MKKILFVISIFVFILSFSSVFAMNNIVISPQKVMVNGVQKNFEVYNIDGNNFFKLRDIAYILKGCSNEYGLGFAYIILLCFNSLKPLESIWYVITSSYDPFNSSVIVQLKHSLSEQMPSVLKSFSLLSNNLI